MCQATCGDGVQAPAPGVLAQASRSPCGQQLGSLCLWPLLFWPLTLTPAMGSSWGPSSLIPLSAQTEPRAPPRAPLTQSAGHPSVPRILPAGAPSPASRADPEA
ncbi:Hypothetical predicted protein [Marmota monax]|uniref:Uncharacterized protein n=1 Tax=Marmota monax TaxID=9995 RepID=A0A5E4A276_MARMO|nr:Hypothetical predicted protein [Marmota monax]